MTVKTRTLRNVALCRVGEWKGLFGPVKITREKLLSAVEAYKDAEVDRPVVRLGHVSKLNAALGDGAPAFGWVENPRVDGDTLRGDLVDIPEKLAGLIGRAYRNGSIEARHNVRTPSGKEYPFAMRGFALLGNSAPAAKGLDPLPKLDDLDAIADLYASEHPGADDECTAEGADMIYLGELDDSLIPRYEQGATDNSGEAPGPGGVTDEQEEPGMAYPKSTLDALGLPEDATEEQVNAVLAERLVAEPEQNPEAVEKSAEDAAEAEAEKPAEESKDVNLSALAAEYREQIVALSAQVEELRADQHQRQVREVIDVALSEGRFGPAKGDELVQKFGANIDQLRDVIDTAFPKGTVNLSEAGSDIALSAKAETPELDAYLDRLGL